MRQTETNIDVEAAANLTQSLLLTSLSLLLLCFFVFLCTISKRSAVREAAVFHSLRESLTLSLPREPASSSPMASVAEIDYPLGELFLQSDDQLLAQTTPMLLKIASRAAQHDSQLTLQLTENCRGLSWERCQTLSFRRASSVYRFLLDSGVPRENVWATAGTSPATGTLRLRFTNRVPR